MKKAKSTEQVIKNIYTNKLQVTTSSKLDKRVLTNSMSTLDKVKSEKSVSPQPGIWNIVARSRIIQIASVIIVISAISLVTLSENDELERYETAVPGVAAKTEMPAKSLNLISLNIAYRKGGMEAVEKQYEKAFNRTGPRPVKLTVEDLFMELNGG